MKYIWAVFIILFGPAWAAAQAQPAASEFAPRASADDLAIERVEALELRLAQMEQLLEAQRNLQLRNRLTETQRLQARLEALESRLSSASLASPANAQQTGATQAAFGQTSGSASVNAGGGAALQVNFNQLSETLRLLQGQTDRLVLQMQELTDKQERASSDNEFRFQALESGVLRANQGISSSSAEPEVIGFVKKAAPVAGLADASALIDVTTPLVGEGQIDDLSNFELPVRSPLNDPQALYQRGLKDLQAGDYLGSRADFAALVADFPSHKMAGSAQYWLGETFYVQRQYKQAAEAFLVGYTTYAQSSKAPDSLLKLGMALTALGEKKTGCNAFAELDAKFPDAPAAIAKRAQIEKKRANCGA